MNVLTFDVETTHRPKANGGFTPLPYFGNHLVSIGYVMVHIDRDKEDGYLCF